MTKQLVVLDSWTVAPKNVVRAFMYMGLHRRSLRKVGGLDFWKLLGTGSGRTFTMRDANPKQWAVLTVWTNRAEYETFTQTKMFNSWQSIAKSFAHVELEPLSAKGTWAGQTPFVPFEVTRWSGPTAALTRARIKARWWVSFWRSVPPVSIDLHNTPGLLATLGIGEAPVGLQGTFSIWQNTDAITQFASRQAPHQAVVARTHQTGWYSEELFARFKVLAMHGTLDGLELSQVNASE